jgi:hypothetical protein
LSDTIRRRTNPHFISRSFCLFSSSGFNEKNILNSFFFQKAKEFQFFFQMSSSLFCSVGSKRLLEADCESKTTNQPSSSSSFKRVKLDFETIHKRFVFFSFAFFLLVFLDFFWLALVFFCSWIKLAESGQQTSEWYEILEKVDQKGYLPILEVSFWCIHNKNMNMLHEAEAKAASHVSPSFHCEPQMTKLLVSLAQQGQRTEEWINLFDNDDVDLPKRIPLEVYYWCMVNNQVKMMEDLLGYGHYPELCPDNDGITYSGHNALLRLACECGSLPVLRQLFPLFTLEDGEEYKEETEDEEEEDEEEKQKKKASLYQQCLSLLRIANSYGYASIVDFLVRDVLFLSFTQVPQKVNVNKSELQLLEEF